MPMSNVLMLAWKNLPIPMFILPVYQTSTVGKREREKEEYTH